MEKKIKSSNALIAEFMEYPGDGNGRYFRPTSEALAYADNLPYHTSWDWLMPVVEKIESDVLDGDISISVDGDNCILLSISYTIYCHATLNSKIESTYQAVIQFIEWYNEQTK